MFATTDENNLIGVFGLSVVIFYAGPCLEAEIVVSKDIRDVSIEKRGGIRKKKEERGRAVV